jgi:hypothetical protein
MLTLYDREALARQVLATASNLGDATTSWGARCPRA